MKADPYEPPKSHVQDVATDAEVRERPAAIRSASNYLWISIAIGAVNGCLELRTVEGPDPGWVVWLLPAIVLVVLALLTIAIYRGVNWARILFVVLFALGALPYFFVLAEMFARSALSGTLSLVQVFCQASAIYLLFTKPGSLWYRRA